MTALILKDKENDLYTMTLLYGGPIVSDKTLEDTKIKFDKALELWHAVVKVIELSKQ